jgi:hypothetical protein
VASKKTRRLIVLSAFAAAAAAGPAIAAISTSAPQDYQAYPGQCLAHFGNIENNVCLGYSNGQPIGAGTPWGGTYGPNGYQSGGPVPGTTISQGIG